MDSPRSASEKSQTRFSTPVSALDDHRHQPESLPRANVAANALPGHNTRRGTAQSINGGRPEMLQVNVALHEAGSISRDFEFAITDDERSGKAETSMKGHSSAKLMAKLGSGRRIAGQHDGTSRSRRSSSSHSVSPPNSVDAFADPRRRGRGNTVTSKAPSDLDLTLHRTVSKGTHQRRQTFSNSSIRQGELGDENASTHDPAEEDVCFPEPEEMSKTSPIDFEELEEFLAESGGVSNGRNRTFSYSSQSHRPKVSDDLRKHFHQDIPQIVTHTASLHEHDSESAIEDSKPIIGDKEGDTLGGNGPSPSRRQSEVLPNRFSFFSSEMERAVHSPELGSLLIPGQTFRDLFELPPEGGVWWLDVLNPSDEELNALFKAFSLHRLTREDIKTRETREKVELFHQYYFVCFRSFYSMEENSDDYLEPLHVYMVIFREGILTFTFSPSPHAANVRSRISGLRDYVALSADWICYAMLDNIVDTFGPVIATIERETDQIEDQVFVARSDDFSSLLRQIGECRKKVMSLMRLLGGKADVIKGFAKRCNEQYTVTPRAELGLYLGDVQDHVVTMMSNLGHFEKMLSRSHSNYLAQLSVDNIVQGNRANEVLSKITLLATILVPLNLITGLFGMNVPVPGKNADGLQWFFGILGVIGAIVVCSLCVARRLRFI